MTNDMIDIAVSVFWFAGSLCSFIGIVFDTVATIKKLTREGMSAQFTEYYYARFIFHLLNLANYGITVGYSTPFISVMNVPIMALSAFGFIAEIVMISVIIFYMHTTRQRVITITLLAVDVAFVATVTLGAVFFIPSADGRRERTVGIISTTTSFVSLVVVLFDARVVWMADAVAELSVYGTALGFSGTGFLSVYGILFRHVFIASRHGVAAATYAIIGVVIAVHHFLSTSETRPRSDIAEPADGGEDASLEGVPAGPSLEYLLHIVEEDTLAVALAQAALTQSLARFHDEMARIEAEYRIGVDDSDIPSTSTGRRGSEEIVHE